jgi:hypothetical protein
MYSGLQPKWDACLAPEQRANRKLRKITQILSIDLLYVLYEVIYLSKVAVYSQSSYTLVHQHN